MFDWLQSLTDTTGFMPRQNCGTWTTDWIALHVGSDLLIWLAYLSLPMVLVAVARHAAMRPFRLQIGLFAAFILACGTTHLIEAVLFTNPVYRLSGVMKAITAIVSWATVFALIPAVPRVLALLPVRADAPSAPSEEPSRSLIYAFALLTALLGTLIRHIVDPLSADVHPYMLGLLAVTLVSWYGGFGPGVVCMLASGVLATYLFVEPRWSLRMDDPSRVFGLGLFFACGVAVAVLGEAQRVTRDRLRGKLTELESVTAAVSIEKQKSEQALAVLDSLVRNAPYGIAYLDADLRFVRVNDSFARVNELPGPAHVGRALWEVNPDFPTELLAEYRQVLVTGTPLVNRAVFGPWGVWEVTAFVVPLAGARPGLGVIGVDVTERHLADARLTESEAQFRELADAMPQIVYETNPVGRVDYINRRWSEYTGATSAQTDDLTPFVHPDDLGEMVASWGRAVDTASPFVAQFRLRGGRDGAYRWFLTRAVPIRGDDGRVTRWYGTSTDIDDQKRQEHDLRESRRFIEAVLHSLSSHLVVIEADGRVVAVNESWRRFGEANGVTADYDWTSANYFEASRHHEYGERVIAGIRSVAAGDRDAFEMEYPCHGGGVQRYFVLRANRFRGDGPVRLVVTHENVTDRVLAERQVRDAAYQLQQLTEGMPLLMWACRPNGECDYFSRQWTDYTGASDDHFGFAWLDAIHPLDRVGTGEAWRAAVGGSTDFDVEYRLRRHDGAYRWFAVRGIALRSQSGAVVRWYGCCIDIEDRKLQQATLEKMVTERTAALHRSNAELREQRIFLDTILDSIAEGIVACDTDGHLKLFNAATRRMHGLPAESLPPDRWAEYYSLFEADGVTPMPSARVPLARAWAGETVRDAEMMIRAGSRPDRYVLCSGVPLRAANGRQFGAVVSMRDMTERREYERQLVVTSAALKASNEELEKFAYIASHDLQEPLRKIQAFGTRLASKHRDGVGEQGKDYIDRMLDSAARMRTLIEDLLAFSRVGSKRLPTDPVNLAAVVQDVQQLFDLSLHKCQGRMEVGPLPTLPGDASQLRQVFQNLIGNALKFARPDVPPVVRVTAARFADLPPDADPPEGEGWRIEVADNGIGFEQEYAERIFELFQRLHGRAAFEGTGLGLAIVRKILIRHGASVAARGRPNEGARFLIDWPLTS